MHRNQHDGAAAPGSTMPTSDTAHVASAGRIEANESSGDPHSAKHATNDKSFATLRALLALAGHELRRSSANDDPCRYAVSRWGHVRKLRDINAVLAFALHVGAAS